MIPIRPSNNFITNPLLEIGIFTRNNPVGLKNVLEYLKKQPYQNIKVYVGDNSDESNADICNNYPFVKYIKHSDNIGLVNNINFVYNCASVGNYFMWMADDDIFSFYYIVDCIGFLEKNKDYVLCSGCTFIGDLIERNKGCSSSMPIVRMFQYLYKVRKNGLFYGVYRNNTRLESMMHCISHDYIFLAKVALFGKIKMLDICVLYKGTGRSSTRKGIISLFGLNKIQGMFLETYSAYMVAKELPGSVLVFILLNLKYVYNSIMIRLNKNYK